MKKVMASLTGGHLTATRRGLLGAGLATLAMPAIRPAWAQDNWPNKTVRVVVPYAPGGGTDITTRAIAEALGQSLGQSFVVENRAGANGIVGSEAVSHSQPDGYTLMVVTSTHVMTRYITPQLPFDPLKDFTPIAMTARYPLVLMTAANSPYKSLADLVKAAKDKPGSIAQGTSDAQSSFTANQFAKRAGVEMIEIPYRGSGAYLAELTGGHLPVAWGSTATAMPLLSAGTIKVLAISSTERFSLMPDVPTVNEGGVQGAEFVGWFGMFAPAKLPAPIADKLNAEVLKAMQTPVLKERLRQLAVDPAALSRSEFTSLLVEEDRRWQQADKDGLLPKG
ncbi:Bug family tripartite tricarboxylate transporter substrate binding protein [Roseomonas marmotae]|uniref:Tripartite tricarboxylate transporter substrate binding protein n=1 Tax=Roseomonas marmotae TaxID=2768161 RepID=A0ABS3KB78_9PROT|nr:tripartite tricarboxylate transporter substrate-binding protein [Roseomonas marmotae]MBO1074724.1 tripartite tricarboxylate transporter substrate binding protein [Roseomonas marmotae]QTI77811.1 tripartite tricarboxylate transporter substrate binding protein [Roseomonas marmotae]